MNDDVKIRANEPSKEYDEGVSEGKGRHGSIIFGTPAGRILELGGDGVVKVRGRVVETDRELVEGFREWLSTAILEKRGNASSTSGAPGGGTTFSSGRAAGPHSGGDVSFRTRDAKEAP